jgi:hypothetical protein
MLAEIKINTAVIILTMQTMLLTFAYYNITTGLLQHGYRKKIEPTKIFSRFDWDAFYRPFRCFAPQRPAYNKV